MRLAQRLRQRTYNPPFIAPVGAPVGTTDHGDMFAALDLGSNSFHLVVARRDADGALVVIDRLREMVQLAAGLDEAGDLDGETHARALACLQRFGQRLRELPADNVRIVGTNTLRQARSGSAFVDAAEALLNHRVEIISGMEEARLIYLGVVSSLAAQGRRLVMDIGGGSTELIFGDGLEPQHKASIPLGCVSYSRANFGDGRISRKAFDAAELAARIEIEPIESRFRGLARDEVVGASGTIKAIGATLREHGWSSGTVTADGLRRLRAAMIRAGRVDALALPGVKPERHAVFAGGVAILRATFAALGIGEMQVADGALREGILLDLPGRLEYADPRAASVERLACRFHADADQAARVATTADALFRCARGPWGLAEEAGWLLRWAARLHEIGLDISHSGYHKHAEYIIENSDLAGFGSGEQRRLAVLVRAARRKFPCARIAALGDGEAAVTSRLAVLLRLAAVLHRGRSEAPLPELELTIDGPRVHLGLPPGWLAEHPLTRADIEQERSYLAAPGFELKVTGTPAGGEDQA